MRFLTKSEKKSHKKLFNHKNRPQKGGKTRKSCISYEKQDFFYTTLFNYLSGIRTTPSFFLPSIFTTIGLSKRT